MGYFHAHISIMTLFMMGEVAFKFKQEMGIAGLMPGLALFIIYSVLLWPVVAVIVRGP